MFSSMDEMEKRCSVRCWMWIGKIEFDVAVEDYGGVR